MICDPTVQKPDLLKDKFWDSVIPQELLYSVGSEGYGKTVAPEWRGSAEEATEVKEGRVEAAYSLGVPGLVRRRRSSVAVYESIRTQGRMSRQTSETGLVSRRTSDTGLIKAVLTRAQAARVASLPPDTPPRPKGPLGGRGKGGAGGRMGRTGHGEANITDRAGEVRGAVAVLSEGEGSEGVAKSREVENLPVTAPTYSPVDMRETYCLRK